MDDPDPLPLSALQHWVYYLRECGLIRLEKAFDDNLHTQRGHTAHAQEDRPGTELRLGLRVERALPLQSEALGLVPLLQAALLARHLSEETQAYPPSPMR
jgi:CRISPR-associated exonuclease Cas4